MAEKSIIFRDNQEVQSVDFINMQDWIGKSLDDVVLDTINSGSAYAGFILSKAAQTQIALSPGRLYKAGSVYARDEVVTLDLYNLLPITQKKQVAIVAWSQTIEEDIQPRDFVIDADTGQAQPQSVAMTSTRYCNVSAVGGVESPSPTYPVLDANVLLLGYVLLDSSGIVSFQQSTATMIDNIMAISAYVKSLQIWQNQIMGQVNTLQTALANLAQQFSNYVLLTDFVKLTTMVGEIWDLVHKPAIYVWYGTDNFLDESLSLVGGNEDGAYAAFISDGLRFAGGTAASVGALQLANPNDQTVKSDNGFLLPTPSGARVRLDCSFTKLPWIEERILQYVFMNTFTVRCLRPSRHRHCCGIPYTPCQPSDVWWKEGHKDPTKHCLSFNSESWEEVEWKETAEHKEDDCDYPQHKSERYKYFWRDRVDMPYWSKTFDNHDHSGQHICQTFLNGQDGWMTGLTVYFTKKFPQPMTILVAECDDDGTPNYLQKTVGRVDLDGAGVTAAYQTPVHIGDMENLNSDRDADDKVPVYIYPTRFDIPPTFLQAGKRYGIHLISSYDHTFSISDQWDCFAVHQGHYWTSGSGVLVQWPSTTNPKSLRFKLHFATWGQWQGNANLVGGGVRADINFLALQKSGGINGIEVLAEAIEPAATNISYQVLIGSTWSPFDSDPNSPVFSSNPAVLQFKAVMIGTTDLMPALSVTNSQVTLRAPRANSFHHISTLIAFGSATNTIKIVAVLVGFNAAHHTCVASLHYASTHNTTFSSSDQTMDDGSIRRTWVFTGLGTITGAYIELDGTNDGTMDPFIVAQEIRYATAA